MAVASRNPFDLLNDETPLADAPSTKPAKEQATTTEAPSARGGQKGKTGPAARGGRYYQRGGGTKSGGRDQPEVTDEPPRDGKREGEEGGRGRGRGGRGRGDRGGGRGGGRGREFDRFKHNATGEVDTKKRVESGWGRDEGNSELKAEVDGVKDAAAEVPANNDWANDGNAAPAEDGWGAPTESAAEVTTTAQESAPAADARRNREEEEDNTLTLDEYLAQQKEKGLTGIVPKLQPRTANDGEDLKDLLKGAIEKKGSDEDAYYAGKPKTAKTRSKPKVERETIDIDLQFSDRPSRGGRGGRGGGDRGFDRGGDRGRGGRGRGGRGRGRGDFQGSNGNSYSGTRQVDVDDKSAFPSLS